MRHEHAALDAGPAPDHGARRSTRHALHRLERPSRRVGCAGWRLQVVLLVLLCASTAAQAGGLARMEIAPLTADGRLFSGWSVDRPPAAGLEANMELGDTLDDVTLRLVPSTPGAALRVHVQFETSLSLNDEGPHLDLLDWKHCTSGWSPAKRVDAGTFVLPASTEAQATCFPSYTQAELRDAIRAQLADDGRSDPATLERWTPKRVPDYDGTLPTAHPGLGRIRVRVQERIDGAWTTVTVVTFLPPMGC